MSLDILVVDDSRVVGAIIMELLNAKGYNAMHALSGCIALDLFKSHKFRLVMTDLVMPGMDGLELCIELKALSNVPVFLCSGSVEKIKKKCNDWENFDRIFYKPLDFAVLFKAIQEYLK